MKYKQVIVMRKDLNMRKGKMIAQGAHSSVLSVLDMLKNIKHLDILQEWIDTGMTKICLYVESEQELLDLIDDANFINIPCSLVTDAGHTEFNGVPTNTCISLGPWYFEELNKLTSNLKLL